GTLAGGVAHDLNNVLTPILMSIDLLRTAVTDPHDLETLETVGTSARRGAEMVGQLLTFARGMEGRRVAVRLDRVIRDAVAILRDTFPKNIRLVERPMADLWPLEADPTQLQQVIINLCVNARDALPDGGQVTIGAENVTIDEHHAARNFGARVGPYVMLEVQDDGTGIPPGVIDRIFDPFFTTKETGKGTGLGLSTTQAIVKGHGGFLRVFSEPGMGAHFRLYFPARPAAVPAAAADEPVTLQRGTGETILVIDDEAPIRHVARQALESFGYRVLLAADGVEGVRHFTRHHDTVAVVVTDMMMPGMDGAATIEALLRIDPRACIIAMSGIDTHRDVTHVGAGRVRQFLAKPFTTPALLEALQRAMRELP
ncbi:MAG TPA: ATP-binding protein, partial [Gemmatimonadales bacterium]|nr:ATP-binding protein [Gemmatimonadales bacterium]